MHMHYGRGAMAELGSFVPFCQALRTNALALVSELTMKELCATIKLNFGVTQLNSILLRHYTFAGIFAGCDRGVSAVGR